MIIGKIWDSEYPWDVRVEKVCAALVDAGHEVHLLCRNRRREPDLERGNRLVIHRLPAFLSIPASIDAALSFPAFFSPRWRRAAERVFRSAGVDLIICRDLPLAPLALSIGRSLRRPVVLDIAEHYPGILRDLYNRHDFRFGNLLARNPLLALVVERWTLPQADHIWVVAPEMRQRLVKLGVPIERITLVSNTPPRSRVSLHQENPNRESSPIPLRMVYLGNVETSRGLPTVFDAMCRARRAGVAATLDVFGDGTSLASDRRSAHSQGLADMVTFHGRVPYLDALQALPGFDVGLIPHHVTDQWRFTLQNKLFDYMAAGLTVVASAMPPVERILSETEAGIIFPDRDANALSQILTALCARPQQREAMGACGRRAVLGLYCWEHDRARLLRSLETVFASPHPQVARVSLPSSSTHDPEGHAAPGRTG